MAIIDYLVLGAAFSRGSAFNYPIPFLFDLRGTLTLILVARAAFSRKALNFFTLPFRNLGMGALTLFLMFYVAGHLSHRNFDFVNELAIMIGTALLVYFYNDQKRLRKGILVFYVAGSLLVSLETILGVIRFGHLPNYHIFSQALGLVYTEKTNHNVFGFTSMIASILFLLGLVHIRKKPFFLAVLASALTAAAAVFFSTSRSAILGLMLTAGWILLFQYRRGRIRINAPTLLVVSAAPFAIGIALYLALTTLGLDSLRYRLINEPLSAVGIDRGVGYSDRFYKYVDKAESIAGRGQYAQFLLNRFQQEPMSLFIGGKAPGMELAAHTMFLNIITDAGIFGLLAYVVFMATMFFSFFKNADRSEALQFYFFPMLAIWIYSQGQNREFMYPIMFALTGGFFREIEMIKEALRHEQIPDHHRTFDQWS